MRWQPHEKETDGDNKSETEEAKKWRLLAEEGVNIRSAAGQQFSRDPNGGKSAEYAGLTNAAKQAFRKEWAKQMHTTVVKKSEKEKSWRTIDSNKGSYEPFAIIVQREGGGPSGLEAARNYVSACVRMAGPWISRNPMTKRDEYLYLKRCFVEEFSECWRQYESRSSTEELAIDEGKVATQGASAAKRKATAEACGNGKKAKGKAGEKIPGPDGTTPPGKGAHENAFGAAMATRNCTTCGHRRRGSSSTMWRAAASGNGYEVAVKSASSAPPLT